MSTPTRPSGLSSVSNTGPSASLLRQLLGDISGTSSPTVLRTTSSAQSTPKPPLRLRSSISRRASSVWVGGAADAQDARTKLRAADEAHGKKTGHLVMSDTLGACRTCSHVTIPQNQITASSPQQNQGKRDQGGASSATSATDVSPKGAAHDGTADNLARPRPRPRPTLSGLQIPSSTIIPDPLVLGEGIARANSPLMFCDSDISSTPSPTEPPTSALTVSSTEATTASDSRPTSRRNPPSTSPGKRERSQDHVASRTLNKRTRTKSFVVTQDETISPPITRPYLPVRGAASDNRCTIREAAFIERLPAPMIKSLETKSLKMSSSNTPLPELSSFRPDIASPEGPPPALALELSPTTPVRARRNPSPAPEPPETPSFARPLHVTDTSVSMFKNTHGEEWMRDISIYKNVHGEEWKQNSLCFNCFRRHGSFNRILTYGYEVCGSDKMLDSHYWEPNGRPYC